MRIYAIFYHASRFARKSVDACKYVRRVREAENPFKPSFTEHVSYKETPPEFMGDTVLLSVIGETDKTKVSNAAV